MAVTGFDNVNDAGIAYPPLTTVHTHKHLLGRLAAEQLHRRIENPDDPPLKIVTPTELVSADRAGPYFDRPADHSTRPPEANCTEQRTKRLRHAGHENRLQRSAPPNGQRCPGRKEHRIAERQDDVAAAKGDRSNADAQPIDIELAMVVRQAGATDS